MTEYIDEGSYVRYIYQGKDKSYYIGLLKDGGLGVIEPNSDQTKFYKNIPNDKTSISSNRIRYINGERDKSETSVAIETGDVTYKSVCRKCWRNKV